MDIRKYKTAEERRRALEKEMHVSLSAIGSFSMNEDGVVGKNCENMIGATQIPLGVAGPLCLRRLANSQDDASKKSKIQDPKSKIYYVPLATTEGALVASVNRGCKAITAAGGATLEVEDIGATRGPVFSVHSIEEGKKLERFVSSHFSDIADVAKKTSSHLLVRSYTVDGAGHYRFVRFVFDTNDAMGLNMATIASDVIARYIQEKTGIRCISLSGNYCVDKKPSWLNWVMKRGKPVRAEAVIPNDILKDVLKTTASDMYDTWLAKCMMGSVFSGSLGFNAQFANVIAAFFLATGQDPGHVVEGSMGITTTDIVSEGLYISIYLPDLMVGAVGGGTGLVTQHEALSLLHMDTKGNKGDHALELASVVGGAVLAGELSLLASLSEGTLAAAHQRLGRGKK